MAVRKRSDRWHYDFSIRSARYRGAIPEARTKKQAEAAETRLRLDVYEGRWRGTKAPPTLAAFALQYLTWAKNNKRSHHSDASHVKQLITYFGENTRLHEISHFDVERLKRTELKRPTKNGTPRRPATVNRLLSILHSLFEYAIENDLATKNPCRNTKKLPENNERTRHLTNDEERRLLFELTAQETVQAIVIIALHTGMRRGEILALNWSDVDFARGQLHIRQSKTDRPRSVPMNNTVRETLARLQPSPRQSQPYIFAGRRDNKRLTTIYRTFRRACERAGIADFHFHDLRHTAATRLADTGADAFTIAEILGHADLKSTARYTHATNERKRAAVTALENFGHKSGTKEKTVTLKLAVNS